MIIKKIAKLAREAKTLGVAFEPVGSSEHQWVGGAWGIYDISDLPPMTFGQICVMFDYSQKVIDDMLECNSIITALADDIQYSDRYISYSDDEIEVHSTFFGDEEFKVFVDNDQTTFAFIRAALLSPVPDTDYTTHMLVRGKNGKTYVFVREGLQTVAVIPSMPIPPVMVENWQKSQSAIYTCMSIYLKSIEDKEKGIGKDAEQYTLDEEGVEDAE